MRHLYILSDQKSSCRKASPNVANASRFSSHHTVLKSTKLQSLFKSRSSAYPKGSAAHLLSHCEHTHSGIWRPPPDSILTVRENAVAKGFPAFGIRVVVDVGVGALEVSVGVVMVGKRAPVD